MVANLRIVIGFAVLPAGLKKVIGQPFTDPEKLGVFHEFLHAFHAARPLYFLVGLLQITAALLLMTQRFATLGAILLMPILVAINALCWSSSGVPTIIVVNLMTLGTLGLLLWDQHKLRAILSSDHQETAIRHPAMVPRINTWLWQRCGLAIALLYFAATAANGGVYRPRGLELDSPSFYLLPSLAILPLITWLIDRWRYRQANAAPKS